MSSINFSVLHDHRGCKRAAQERLEGLLLEGLDSGTAEPWTEADVEAIRAAVRGRLKKQRGAHGATSKG
jgi:hypothetical protein